MDIPHAAIAKCLLGDIFVVVRVGYFYLITY